MSVAELLRRVSSEELTEWKIEMQQRQEEIKLAQQRQQWRSGRRRR